MKELNCHCSLERQLVMTKIEETVHELRSRRRPRYSADTVELARDLLISILNQDNPEILWDIVDDLDFEDMGKTADALLILVEGIDGCRTDAFYRLLLEQSDLIQIGRGIGERRYNTKTSDSCGGKSPFKKGNI